MNKKHKLIIELEFDIQGETTADKVDKAIDMAVVEDITVRLVNENRMVINRVVCDNDGLLEISEMFNSMIRRGLN